MSAEPNALAEMLASSVADGAPVDWEQAELAATADERRIVQHLRLVSSIAELYRSLPRDEQEAPAPPAGEPHGPRWGHLVLLESIGRGTSGEVHRAWDLELQREVALKLFPPDPEMAPHTHTQVLSEARRLARVRHPNVATVYGADRDRDRVGFWMELVHGSSLQDVLDRNGPFGARETAIIGSDLCGALAAVHAAGLLHRDIKAQNVLREQGGRIVLTDFGTGEEAGSSSTRIAGTPMYLAPEVLRGRGASAESDLYSLGVLLFLMLTGSFPVAARTMPELVRGHKENRRRRLRDARPDLPAALVDAVERALSPDAADRYESAGAFDEALRRTLVHTRPEAETRPRPAEERRARVGKYGLFAAAALAAVLLALAAVAWWGRSPVSSPASSTASIDSLAVLPLEDQSGRNGALAGALTEQLIATLGNVRALRVISADSVTQFQGTAQPAGEIARRLGVRAVLRGSVAVGEPVANGARPVKIDARLLAAGDGSEVWAGTFDSTLGDALALGSAVARSIVREARVKLSPAEADRLAHRTRTSPAAEEAYFQGRYSLNQYGVDSASRALKAFERATRLDPDFAPAFAGLARTYVTLGDTTALSQPEARARALAAANRALSLDPALSDANVVLGDLKFRYDWDWSGGEAAYVRALDLSPSQALARTQFARFLAAAGRLDEAVVEATRAGHLDPLSAEAAQTRGLILYYARDYEGAARALEEALSLDPGFVRARAVLSRVRDAEGRIDEGLEEIDRAIAGAQGADPTWHAHRARLLALGGDEHGALQVLRALNRQHKSVPPENVAYVHLALGNHDKALALLEAAADLRDPSLLWVGVDPRVDRLRGDERFTNLLTRLGVPRSGESRP